MISFPFKIQQSDPVRRRHSLNAHCRSHLHGAPAHGDHVKQGDGLHVLLFAASSSRSPRTAAAGFGTFALDVLGALVRSFPPSLSGLKTWREMPTNGKFHTQSPLWRL